MVKRENPPKEAKDAEADKKAADYNLKLLRDLNYQAPQPSQRAANLQNFRLPAHHDPPSKKAKKKAAEDEEMVDDPMDVDEEVVAARPKAKPRVANCKDRKGKGKATELNEKKWAAEDQKAKDEAEEAEKADRVFEEDTQKARAASRNVPPRPSFPGSGVVLSSPYASASLTPGPSTQMSAASYFGADRVQAANTAVAATTSGAGGSPGGVFYTAGAAPLDGEARQGWTYSATYDVYLPPTGPQNGHSDWICNKCHKRAKPQHLFYVDSQGNRLRRKNCAMCCRNDAWNGDFSWMPDYPWDT
jgi:hypothetical protein